MFSSRSGVQQHYSSKTLVGNWSEEWALREDNLREFLNKKETGGLLVHQVQSRVARSLMPAPLTPLRKDGFVRYGDAIMVYSAHTHGVISVDVQEQLPSFEQRFGVTTSTQINAPVARNVFIIEANCDNYEEKNGQVVRFGEEIRFRCHSSLKVDVRADALADAAQVHNAADVGMYLHSQPKSHLSASKVTSSQEVSVLVGNAKQAGYDGVWVLAHVDAAQRIEALNEPVPISAKILIIHKRTNNPLSSNQEIVQRNDFGSEFELCCSQNRSKGKKLLLLSSLLGKGAQSELVAFQGPNHFALLAGQHEESNASDEQGDAQ